MQSRRLLDRPLRSETCLEGKVSLENKSKQTREIYIKCVKIYSHTTKEKDTRIRAH